jgi:CheY-like chemotaxis protein
MDMTGHEVRTAYDGPSALAEARTFKPDVVVLDIGLPGMDGYEVAHCLRQEPGGDRLMLLALTGYGQEEDLRRSREAGFDHHFVKPIELEKFKDMLESWCRVPVAR